MAASIHTSALTSTSLTFIYLPFRERASCLSRQKRASDFRNLDIASGPTGFLDTRRCSRWTAPNSYQVSFHRSSNGKREPFISHIILPAVRGCFFFFDPIVLCVLKAAWSAGKARRFCRKVSVWLGKAIIRKEEGRDWWSRKKSNHLVFRALSWASAERPVKRVCLFEMFVYLVSDCRLGVGKCQLCFLEPVAILCCAHVRGLIRFFDLYLSVVFPK